jgi:hypothetical protein
MSRPTRNAYTYGPDQRRGIGWDLFDDADWPTIQRIDETAAFASDEEAAFHVLCAAAFDPGPEGHACRAALRTIIDFGARGLNPMAAMLDQPEHDP